MNLISSTDSGLFSVREKTFLLTGRLLGVKLTLEMQGILFLLLESGLMQLYYTFIADLCLATSPVLMNLAFVMLTALRCCVIASLIYTILY